MGIGVLSLLFVLALGGALMGGRRAGRQKRLAIGLSISAVPLLLLCNVLVRRQDLLVSLSGWILGDALLLLEFWIMLPAVFILSALGSLLAKARDRRAAGFMTAVAVAVAGVGGLFLGFWPYSDLDASASSDLCLQSTGYSCGAASTANFLRVTAGSEVSEREMARRSGVLPLQGVTMAGAWRGVESVLAPAGRRAQLLRPTLEALLAGPFPAIIPVRHGFLMDHMVVLLSARGDLVEVADPLQGRVWWLREDLRRMWRGEAIVPEVARAAIDPDLGGRR